MLDRLRVVLVNTTHPGNIGAVARAMKNMGVSQLYLVAPKSFPDEHAYYRAKDAVDVLDNAIIVNTVDEAINDTVFVVGASARVRRVPWPMLNPRQMVAQVQNNFGHSAKDVALLFGREDRGLTNDELQKCQLHVHIPANPQYSVLNVAQAAQVILYEWRMACLDPTQCVTISPESHWDVDLASAHDRQLFYRHLEHTLESIEFLKPQNPRQLMTRIKRLFARVNLDQMELNILRGMLAAIDKKTQPEAPFKANKS